MRAGDKVSENFFLAKINSHAHIQVGISYGRKMMTGHLLAAKGLHVSEIRVGDSLKRICPTGHAARRTNTVNRINPVRYSADYFGHKLHLDQNEKLSAFGVTHVIARDGFSGKIVAYMTLPIKNNVAIYDGIFKLVYLIYDSTYDIEIIVIDIYTIIIIIIIIIIGVQLNSMDYGIKYVLIMGGSFI